MAKGKERRLQDFLAHHLDKLDPELELLQEEFTINAEPWLSEEYGPEDPVPEGDDYSHRKKKVDLLCTNNAGELVLCELKVYGGSGDGAPLQLWQYLMMLRSDTDAQKRVSGMMNKDWSELSGRIVLVIVVAGLVSRLLRMTVTLLQRAEPVKLRVFQAIQDKNPGKWTFEEKKL